MTSQLPISQWRVLFFSPNAGLWQTSQLEHELANGLAQRGAQVTVLRCKGLFDSFCPVMKANLLIPESSTKSKKSTCKSCQREEAALRGAARYTTLWIDDFVDTEARARVEAQVQSVSADNWQYVTAGGIPIGIYSTYLSMLHHKVPDVTATQNSWNEYVSDLRNSQYAAEALPTIFPEIQPTHGVIYNPLYPTNRVFTELVLKSEDIQYIGLSASGYVPDRYSTLALYRSVQSSQTAVDSHTLLDSMNNPLSEREIKLVSRHLGQLVQGSDPWVYSTPPTAKPTVEIKQILGIENEHPVAVVLIGSPDETRSSALVGAEFERVPIDQVSTVQEFIEQSLDVARTAPDINFIFRLHPRLAPNKRESIRSPDLDAIEALLATRSSNVTINAPGDGIGLYDVARIASFGINHASSAGLEFLALGIPVIHYDTPRLNAYPPHLGLEVVRMDPIGFLEAVNQAKDIPVSVEIAVPAWRWYAVTLLRAVTHKSWNTQTAPPKIPQEPRLQWLRSLIPQGFRESVSRKRDQQQRNKQVNQVSESVDIPDWIEECIARIGDFDNSIIWNPLSFVRGSSMEERTESDRVAQQIALLRKAIKEYRVS